MTQTTEHLYVLPDGRYWNLVSTPRQVSIRRETMEAQQNGPETGVLAPVDPGASPALRGGRLVTSSYPRQAPLSPGVA